MCDENIVAIRILGGHEEVSESLVQLLGARCTLGSFGLDRFEHRRHALAE
jgi:hypothetical protein